MNIFDHNNEKLTRACGISDERADQIEEIMREAVTELDKRAVSPSGAIELVSIVAELNNFNITETAFIALVIGLDTIQKSTKNR